ncbi:MAG TPA: DUF3916 domain-containing protein [Hyphomonadaceae bacterium]|nr:DUF3916 domain-containing protein [Hyphomonadaceae bacterium]HPN06427.1 DUF3916 domain-containing protein [Hyphomonadaceae bacterium]
MRRLDTRPLKKLRNPQRHLRALAKWPAQIIDQLPDADLLARIHASGDRFWNYKVPVFSKLVEPPHATPEAQRACIAAILAAAEAIETSPHRPPNCRVACLVTTPFLFQSEVTLFFDDDYFRTFLPPKEKSRASYDGGWVEAEPADPSSLAAIRPADHAKLEFQGGTRLREYDEAWGRDSDRINWVWAYAWR